jgi:hypothetical protein
MNVGVLKYFFQVYYESIKREPKIRGINKCRCDERLQTKTKEFTRLPYTGLVLEILWVVRQTFFFFRPHRCDDQAPAILVTTGQNALARQKSRRKRSKSRNGSTFSRWSRWYGCGDEHGRLSTENGRLSTAFSVSFLPPFHALIPFSSFLFPLPPHFLPYLRYNLARLSLHCPNPSLCPISPLSVSDQTSVRSRTARSVYRCTYIYLLTSTDPKPARQTWSCADSRVEAVAFERGATASGGLGACSTGGWWVLHVSNSPGGANHLPAARTTCEAVIESVKKVATHE